MAKGPHHEEVRRRILASALALFTDKGFYNTKIQEIAGKAKISTGSVYTYFNSKEEIALNLFKEAIDLFKNALRDATTNSTTVQDFIQKTVKAVLIFSEKNAKLSKYLWLCRHDEFLKPFETRPFLLRYDDYGKRFAKFINTARRERKIRPYSTHIIWTLVFGSPLSYVRDWFDKLMPKTPSEISGSLSEAIWLALKSD